MQFYPFYSTIPTKMALKYKSIRIDISLFNKNNLQISKCCFTNMTVLISLTHLRESVNNPSKWRGVEERHRCIEHSCQHLPEQDLPRTPRTETRIQLPGEREDGDADIDAHVDGQVEPMRRKRRGVMIRDEEGLIGN